MNFSRINSKKLFINSQKKEHSVLQKLRNISKNERFDEITISILFISETRDISKNSKKKIMFEINEAIQIVINAAMQRILTTMMQIMSTLFSSSSRSQKLQKPQKASKKININDEIVK